MIFNGAKRLGSTLNNSTFDELFGRSYRPFWQNLFRNLQWRHTCEDNPLWLFDEHPPLEFQAMSKESKKQFQQPMAMNVLVEEQLSRSLGKHLRGQFSRFLNKFHYQSHVLLQ